MNHHAVTLGENRRHKWLCDWRIISCLLIAAAIGIATVVRVIYVLNQSHLR